jgi:hypothetical protein
MDLSVRSERLNSLVMRLLTMASIMGVALAA